MNILFLGNSLMFFNDMPAIFDNIAKSFGKDLFVRSITKGGATMTDFTLKESRVGQEFAKAISEQAWDYIIIEPSRRITPYENSVLEVERASAKILYDAAKANGAEILLYCVWGNNSGDLKLFKADSPTHMTSGEMLPITREEHARFMHGISLRVSNDLGGVRIIEAGSAFENLITEHPEINLYHEDKKHPSPEGSYLAACAVYSTIFGEKTEGASYTFGLETAEKLQKASDAAVIDKKTL
ncbi:MAG: hypothetical protein E7633_03200 [Ruminococcaceae bacterium]|nr:hypothetical protein [Oscillospiraceae bacterium]